MIGATTLLHVSTLGRFEIRRHQELLTGGNWSRRKVNDLFKLLLSAEQHRLHREQVQEILWPASTAEQAANSFGKTLYLLRRALEPGLAAGKGSVYVLLDHDTLMLIPDSMRIDADIFESAAKQLQVKMRSHTGKQTGTTSEAALLDEFDATLSLYQGDYLPEDLYEDWSQRRRDRLRRIHSWLLENAAELALASGLGPEAREYLSALLERNTADEQTHRQLMLVYARMGRRSEALNQYLALRKALKEELRASPLPETNELFREIQMGQIPVDLTESNRRGRKIETRSTSSAEVATANLSAPNASDPLVNAVPVQEVRIPTGELVARQDQEMATIPPAIATTAPTIHLDPDRILKAELVGREEEISQMQHAYSQARNGVPRVVFLSGEPGIGKTRLARELTRWGEETQQATVLWGNCYEMSGLLPYQPIADAINAHVRTCSPEKLRTLLGNSAGDLAKIAPEVRFKLADLPPSRGEVDPHPLADLPSSRGEVDPHPLGPEAERRNLYSAVARYFNALALEAPLIIILDDLQWADAATLQLLSYLTLQSGTNPFDTVHTANNAAAVPLYLLLYRADEVHATHPLRGLIASLARGNIGEEVRLQRLSEGQVEQLLVSIAGQPVGSTFVNEIYQQTEGNPFFVGEAIRSLVFEGKVRWTGERWQATVTISELELPQSVRLLIERRLVQLTPECRTTLTQAAVIGREFSSALLCQALGLSEEVVAEHIDSAIQFQILTPLVNAAKSADLSTPTHIPRKDVDLAFTHDNFREVLYRWLNPLRRRVLHRQVAQAIESRYATELQPYYSTLAYHYQMAEKPAQAVDYLLKAAYLASSIYAFIDAANSMKTAVDLLVGDTERPRRAALLHQLANIYLFTGSTDEAIKAGLAACALWRDLGDVEKQAETYLDVAFFCHWQGREWEAVKYIQSALECLKTAPYGPQETYLTAKAYTQWGMAVTIMGEIPEALDKLHQADLLHQQIGGNDAFISIVSLWSLSWCAYLTETPQKMLAYAMQAVEVCRTSHKPEWEPMMNYTAAWASMLLGQLNEGEQAARKALKGAEQHGVVGALGWANLVLAFLAIQAGRWEEAQQTGESAYTIATMLHDADLQARVLWSRSVCAGWQGDWERAISEVQEALQIARQEGEILLMVYPHLLVQAAKAHFHAGKPEEAQTYLDQGMQLAQSRRYRQLPAIGLRLQGRIWQAQGKFEEAQPCFEQSLTELLAMGDMVEYARTQESYGLYYLARNSEDDFERGQSLIKSAQALFEKLGVNG